MSELKGIVAEDEPVLRAKLRSTLADLWPELVVCAEAENGLQALRALNEHAPAVLFLDIEMPGLSGLEVAKQASGKCHVVFVTAYESYAVAAFEQGAVDYVLKPFSPARLATAVSRLREKVRSVPANLDGLLEALDGAAAQHARGICAGSRFPNGKTCDSSRSTRSAISARTTNTRSWSRRSTSPSFGVRSRT